MHEHYIQLPERIYTYSAADQDRMAPRQLTVMSARKIDLADPERGTPLPLAYPVEDASQK